MRTWHLRRLRAMPWGELRLRAARRLRDFRHARAFAGRGAEAVAGPPPPSRAFLEGWRDAPWILEPERLAGLARHWPPAWTDRTRAEAEEILAGRYRWLGAVHDLGVRPRWLVEPVSGVEFPPVHWCTLPPPSPPGACDLKHLWEPNLHAAFVTLAKAWLLTGEGRYRDHLELLWRDWLRQNPPLCGSNYLAPVEIGLRLLHWAAALRFLAAREAPAPDLLETVFRDVHFQRFTIADNLSAYSSANNHLIGELASLILIDRAFPGLVPETETAALDRELRAELFRQFHLDGGNREQAFHYHAFPLAFLLLAAQSAGLAGAPWGKAERDRLNRAVEFLAAGQDRGGGAFRYGDCDDSEVLPLAEGTRHPYRPLLAQGRLLAGRPSGLGPEGDERTAWLLGETGLPDPGQAAPAPAGDGVTLFPQTGQAFLRRGPLEAHLNAGELGYLSIAAHAHADALSVQVTWEGTAVVVDPGTYSYRGGNRWREYLVGTSAHPTVTVEGRNQAERLGPFLWGRRYRARLVQPETPADPAAAGEHDGYRNLGVLHRRRVVLEGPDAVRVEDELQGSAPRAVRLTWPFAPGEAALEGAAARWRGNGVEARLEVEGLPGAPRLEHGDPGAPGTPCVSPAYDRLEPAPAWIWEGTLDLPARWVTRIRLRRASRP